MATCPYCSRYFPKKQLAVEHIEKYHSAMLENDHMDASQSIYYSTHHTLNGVCQCGCGRKTEWNYHTGKPYKVSSNPECRVRLRKLALQNHKKVYGTETLLNDMEHQKEMEAHRKSAGTYKFADGGEVPFLSSLEKNFLQFCDKIMEFSSNMVQVSPETFTYYDDVASRDRQYIPDYYLPDYNLLIEIKDGGKVTNTNPAFVKETKYKVALKDAVMKKQTKYNYIRISGANYGPFVEILYALTHSNNAEDETNKKHKNLVVITESACVDPDEIVNYDPACETMLGTLYLMVAKSPYLNSVTGFAISENADFARQYLYRSAHGSFTETSHDDPFYSDDQRIQIYQYFGDPDKAKAFMSDVVKLSMSWKDSDAIDLCSLLELMSTEGINFSSIDNLIVNNMHKFSDFILMKEVMNHVTELHPDVNA